MSLSPKIIGAAIALSCGCSQTALARPDADQAAAAAMTPPTAQAVTTTPAISQPTAQDTKPSGTPSAAAEPSEGLVDIVVTAQRRAENLQNVPIAITAIGSESLTKAGVTDLQSLQVVAPSLNFAQATGYSLPRIRGIGTGAAGPGVENSVALFVDGVYIAASAAGLLSFNNIAQISVLKGPQGTLFGRNATGGVIQVTTLDPGQTATLNASATYGNLDTYGGNLYAAGPLSSTLAADVAVRYNDQNDGFGRNLTTGNDANTFQEFDVRSKIKWEPTESTTIRLIGDYSEAKGARPNIQIVPGSLPISGVPFRGGKFDTVSTFDPRQKTKQKGVSLQIDQGLGSLSLVSITAYL